MTQPKIARVAALATLAFVLIGSYELIRSAADAVYVRTYGSGALPYAWLGVAGASFVVVGIYSRYAQATHLMRLLAIAAAICSAVLALVLGLRAAGVPGATYALYVFKDVYIVVLIEIFWTFANVVFDLKTARWIYGLFCAMGSLGGAAGGVVTKLVAERWGAETALWMLAPVLVGVAVACGAVRDGATAERRGEPGARPSFLDGLSVVARSRYLTTMLVLICTVQLVITLVDFEFNAVAEATYEDADRLTAVLAQVYSTINASAVVLQLLTGPVLKLAGVAGTLIAIPCLLGGSLGVYLVAPHFAVLAVAKVLSKCLDYSLFRAAKEILYIPLDYAEKTKGKAVVDMLTYRVAKGIASLFVLVLVWLSLQAFVGPTTLVLAVVWLAAAVLIGRQYRRRAAA